MTPRNTSHDHNPRRRSGLSVNDNASIVKTKPSLNPCSPAMPRRFITAGGRLYRCEIEMDVDPSAGSRSKVLLPRLRWIHASWVKPVTSSMPSPAGGVNSSLGQNYDHYIDYMSTYDEHMITSFD